MKLASLWRNWPESPLLDSPLTYHSARLCSSGIGKECQALEKKKEADFTTYFKQNLKVLLSPKLTALKQLQNDLIHKFHIRGKG